MRVPSTGALTLLLIGCSGGTNPGRQVVARAAAALGGIEQIREVHTLALEGSGEFSAFGQSRTLDSELLKWRVTSYRRLVDFGNRRWREESVFTPTYITGYPDSFPVVAGMDRDVAYDIDGGTPSRLDDLAARDRGAALYHDPIGFLRAAADTGAKLENARRNGDEESVDLIAEGQRFVLTISDETGLPIRIVSTGHEPALGDVTVTTEFDDYAETGRLRLPRRITRRMDDRVVVDMKLAGPEINPGAEVPEAPQGIRDSTPPAVRVEADEVAKGIWHLTGQGHHSVLIEFADHLALIEAPVDDARTLAVIARARSLRPDKPLTEVINTHHHFDHSGGIRAAISQGLTVITHADNRRFYEDAARRPSTVARDALSRNPKPLSLVAVADKEVLTDGARAVEVYPIAGNGHSASMLMVYFPKERLLVEADVYQAPPPGAPAPVRYPFAGNLVENVRQRGLKVDRIVPIHGRIVPFSVLVAASQVKRD